MDARAFEDFAASGYNRIPVYHSFKLDVSSDKFLSLLQKSSRALLEFKDELCKHISIFALSATEIVTYHNRIITVEKNKKILQQFEIDTIPTINPLDWLNDYHSYHTTPRTEILPQFSGGLIGYMGATLCEFTQLKFSPMASNNLPDFAFMLCDDFLVIDHKKQQMWLITYIDPIITHAHQKANERLMALAEQITTEVSLEKKINEISTQIIITDDDELITNHDISEIQFIHKSSSHEFSTFIQHYKKVSLPAYFIHFDNYYLYGFGKNSLKKHRQNITLDFKPTTWPNLNIDQTLENYSKIECQKKLSTLCLHQEFHTGASDINCLLPPEFTAIDMIKAVMPHPLQFNYTDKKTLNRVHIKTQHTFIQQQGLMGMLTWHDDFVGQFSFHSWLKQNQSCHFVTIRQKNDD